jgi:hypothetical protein
LKILVGRYRCAAVGNLEETAYVEDGGIGSFGVRASYEAKGYKPAFDDLPPDFLGHCPYVGRAYERREKNHSDVDFGCADHRV